MAFLYNVFVFFYFLAIQVASLFNEKAKLWIAGRRDIFKHLKSDVDGCENIVWFHAASLGEFEQGRPVLEAFKEENPEYKILLTFFSPSGYEVRKNYQGADFVYYLPIDLKRNVKRFLQMVQPKFVFFIKYEFWFNYLKSLNRLKIPVFVISANFRKNQHFFKWYGGWFRKHLRNINWYYVQNENSSKLLLSIGIHNISVSGDTRFDRVVEIAKYPQKFPLVEQFASKGFVLLAGSSWPDDENLLLSLILQNIPDFKLIIAPHEIHEEHLLHIENIFSDQKTKRLSQVNTHNILNSNVLIIDGMGFLSSLYQYCHVAYIGGGFGKGIHNILEAVAFGKPVVFGPNYEKFVEAVKLVDEGGAFSFQNEVGLISLIHNLEKLDSHYEKSAAICTQYIESNKGATSRILQSVSKQYF